MEKAICDPVHRSVGNLAMCLCSLRLCRTPLRAFDCVLSHQLVYCHLPNSDWADCILGVEADDYACLFWNDPHRDWYHYGCHLQERNWVVLVRQSQEYPQAKRLGVFQWIYWSP